MLPLALLAVTVQRYVFPLMSPLTVDIRVLGSTLVVLAGAALPAGGVQETLYPVSALPPSAAANQVSVALPVPGTVDVTTGLPGTPGAEVACTV